MKRNMLLTSFVLALFLVLAGVASAANLANSVRVELNGEEISNSNQLVSFSGEVVPVRVTFIANENSSDVKIEVSTYDGRNDINASTERFDVISGKVYTKLLSLKMPSDIKNGMEELTLNVKIYDSRDSTENYNSDYKISMQRDSYSLDILSVDYSTKVAAGEVVPVSVVVNNDGFNQADDNYIVASIPALGISSRGYVGDLSPVDSYEGSDGEEDSVYSTVYLKVPSDAKPGVYDLQVTAYNGDSESTVKKLISVGNSGNIMVLPSVKNQDLKAGDTATYNLVVVNSANNIKVLNVSSVSGSVLDVTAPSVITVGPESSKTIPITVNVATGAAVGTYTFSVDVNGKQTVMGANIIGGSSTSDSMVALTVVLVIIFVVLLAVLVILLTKKEKPSEEVETSYY